MIKPLEILEEDNDILVCRKPAGIPVQTSRPGQQDMESLLKNYRAVKGEKPEIYLVHRLDQPVEGVMVFAKNRKAAAALSRQIRENTVDKWYEALVEGFFDSKEGALRDYLLRDGKTNTSSVAAPDTPGAKQAVLRYRVLEEFSVPAEPGIQPGNQSRAENQIQTPESDTSVRQSRVEIHLETGRHHQIRVQMAHAGHPLVGDKKYNPNCGSGYLPIRLCSVGLEFVHPSTGKHKKYRIEPSGFPE